jgi:hypothetical protein
MRCAECGAGLPGEETCGERFGALLAAEEGNEELRRLHGLTVLTYHLQHPSLTKPWYQLWGAEVMRRAFGQGEDWVAAIEATMGRPGGFDRERGRWRQGGPQKGWERAFNERKAAAGSEMPGWVKRGPIAGEATIADIEHGAPAGQTEQVVGWARSVAEHRVLGSAGGTAENRPGGG